MKIKIKKFYLANKNMDHLLEKLVLLAILVALGYYSYNDKKVARSANVVLLSLLLLAFCALILISALGVVRVDLADVLGKFFADKPAVEVHPRIARKA